MACLTPSRFLSKGGSGHPAPARKRLLLVGVIAKWEIRAKWELGHATVLFGRVRGWNEGRPGPGPRAPAGPPAAPGPLRGPRPHPGPSGAPAGPYRAPPGATAQSLGAAAPPPRPPSSLDSLP